MTGLLRSALPGPLVAAIDWTSLLRLSGSFVDEELREHHTDLLFTARIGTRPLLLYILCEHKSDTDPDTVFQLLRYVVRIWEAWRRQHPQGLLPPVLPFVLHHGDKPWSGPTRLHERIDLRGIPPTAAQALCRLLPDLGCVLDDLAAQSEEHLQDRALSAIATLTLLFLQYARGRPPDEVATAIDRWQRFVAAVLDQHGQEALLMLWLYLLQATDVEPERIVEALQDPLGRKLEETLMTTADRLRKEGMIKGEAKGRAEGRAEGLAEGQANLLLRLLATRFGPVPAEVEARVCGAGTDDLERWAEAVLTAHSLDGVFASR